MRCRLALRRRVVRHGGYRRLAEELSAMQRETTSELQKANGALTELHAKIRQVEQALQELDRVLKTVD